MERTALVGFTVKNQANRLSSSLEELRRLVETAGGEVLSTVVQHRPRKDPATLVGRGKVEEIARRAKEERLDAVVFDDDLTPAQQRNLQEAVPAKILDRTRLILDIFAQRARSREGKLQVELAQLNYLLPRATEKFGQFEQQTGGIGTRGPGERKLEVDQRHIRQRIDHIKKEIEKVRVHRSIQRENRRRVPLPIVALVGYTNVGKSTLLNALDRTGGAPVYADDKLFATLDPTTRRVKLPGGRTVLFVDTVGFIQKLPHHLVAAFHATLEEIADANLLVQVVDAADPEWNAHVEVVKEVIRSLAAEPPPEILLFNKADRLPAPERAALKRAGRLPVSARTGEGLDAFLREVQSHLEETLIQREFVLPHRRRDLLPMIYKTSRVLTEEPARGGTRLRVRIDEPNWGRLQKELSAVDGARAR